MVRGWTERVTALETRRHGSAAEHVLLEPQHECVHHLAGLVFDLVPRSCTTATTMPVRQYKRLLRMTMLHGGLVIPVSLLHALCFACVSLLKHAMDHLNIQLSEIWLLNLTRLVDILRRSRIHNRKIYRNRLITLSLACLSVELSHATPFFCFFCRCLLSLHSQFCGFRKLLLRAL